MATSVKVTSLVFTRSRFFNTPLVCKQTYIRKRSIHNALNMENKEDLDSIMKEFVTEKLSPDECFCMVLSLFGYEHCRANFLSRIKGIKITNTRLYNQLVNVYKGYFESENDQYNLPDKLDCAVENGFYANDSHSQDDSKFDMDMELAIKLSLQASSTAHSYAAAASVTTGHQPYHKDTPEHSDCIKHTIPSHLRKDQVPVKVSIIQAPVASANSIPHIPGMSSAEGANVGKKKRKKHKKAAGIKRQLANPPVIYWFRRDLRLYDNPALVSAALSGSPIIPIFVWSDKEESPTEALATGGATKYWLHMALPTLNRDLIEKYNNPLIFRKSNNYLKDILDIVQCTGARTLIMNDLYEPYLKHRDDAICKSLKEKGITCERHHSYLLHHPDCIRTESICMRGIGSVTHFMECCRQSSTEPKGLPVDLPSCLPIGDIRPDSVPFEELGLGRLPLRKDGTVIDWAKVIRENWDFSENGAWEALQLFLSEGVRSYEKESSRGDQLNTCRISPYLHFGQISPRTVLSEGRHMKSPKFMRKLAWRDLSYWLLSIFTDLPYGPTRPQYQLQRWSDNKSHLKAWQKGNTGYPLVDAAMRQLWLTGWMNNYMRHVVASFLISYLHITWREGYLWFQDTLLDADVAINAMMWQNGGMCGLDQWNFVMHPVDAAMTCDPKGDYVRKWVPELSNIPEEFIHKPWKCPPSIMRRAGVVLGTNYPHRIITDLEDAREQSLRDVVNVRQQFPYLIDPHTGNDLLELSNGAMIPLITRKEFKYKTRNPASRENTHNAVLRGYRGRKRDELVEYLNQRDFMASTIRECTGRHERGDKKGDFVVLG